MRHAGIGLAACAAMWMLCAGCSSSEDGKATPPPGGSSPDGGADASSDGEADASEPDAGCFPSTCSDLGADCGTALDGCGGTIECGSCEGEGEICGGGGPNRCGTDPCESTTCEDLGAACGYASDGCGGVLNCGGCPPPSICAGLGTANQCECVPMTCDQVGAECGTVPDGCGDVIECGTCSGDETCGGGGPNLCGTDACSPKSCTQLGASCGWVSDGCATAIECGSCDAPETCGGAGEPNQCGCLAKSCAQLGASCGSFDTGCGPVDCGSCESPETCGGGGISNVCGCTCTLPHAITACEGGSCTIVGCDPGWANCNGVTADGCEASLQTSADHCGSCGNDCDYPHASGTCIAGQCQMGSCDFYYEDCNGSETDGCEVYTRSDPDNCGGCGYACSLPHSQEDCYAGKCVVASCSTGWGDCDGSDGNGCERPLGTTSDCGGCGDACGTDETCSNGSCRCGTGPACGSGEYCYEGKGCYDLPTMTWTPVCMNAGVDHHAPDYLYDYKIYGRPGATVRKYNRNVSCNGAPYVGETWTMPAAGWLGETFESSAVGCFETLGQWETWAEIDGHETVHHFVTFYSSLCGGASTCTQAKSYCESN